MSNHLVPYEYYKFIINNILIDLRSGEIFNKGSFPGAVSFPAGVFESKEHFLQAIRIKWPSQILYVFDQKEEFRRFYIDESRLIYLEGGYENYLEWQDSIFRGGPQIFILGGKAGSGKTELIHLLSESGEQTLDLEHLAGHKGSVFGNLGNNFQQNNDIFLHRIFKEWISFDPGKPVWMEEEGPFLGQNVIPPVLYKRMLDATMIELELSFRDQLDHIVREYGNEPAENFIDAIRKLEKRMGVSANHKAIHLYSTGDLTGSFSLLLRYYDSGYEQRRSLYRKGIHHRMKIETDSNVSSVEKLIAWRKSL